jgi:hypothetical protein
MEAMRFPAAPGVKVTLIVQFAFAARVAGLLGHVLVWAKSELFVPLIAMPEIVKGALPLLVRLSACAVLLVPTS